VRLVRVEIVEGIEPVKLFWLNDNDITLPAEQDKPVHTGDEHFEATLVQFQAGILDWMLVLVMKLHKPISSPVRAAEGERLSREMIQ
jgi:hypothetical protein